MIGLAAAAAASVLLPPQVRGDTWDNSSGDAMWSNAANWLDNTEPLAANLDSVDFPSGFPNADSTITLSSGEYARSLSVADSYTFTGGSLNLSAGVITLPIAGKTLTINSVITNTFGLTKQGAGTLILGGANTFTGPVQIGGGPVFVSADNRLGDPTNNISLNGVTATLVSSSTFSSARTFASSSSGGNIAPAAVTTLSLSGSLNGFSVLMTGAGTLALNAQGFRSASTTISNGVLRLNHNQGLGTGTVDITNSGDLELGSGILANNPLTLWDQSQLRIGSGVAATYAGTISVMTGADAVLSSGNSSGTLTIGDATHAIGGGSGSTLSVVGTAGGSVVLPFLNAYEGNWSVGGTLIVAHPQALGTATVNIQGTLELAGISLSKNLNLNNLGTLLGTGTAASTGVITIPNSSNTTLSAPTASDTLTIGDSANDLTGGLGANLSKTGAGTVVLAQSTNFQGTWFLQQGTLRVNHANGLGPVNLVLVNAGVLEMAASVKTGQIHIASGALAKVLANGNRTLQINTLSIAGTGALDMADNDLVVNSGSYTQVRALVLSGFGNTTGGITSSTSNGSQILALFDNSLVGAGTWNGASISANATVGKYTYFGDANIDGQVTGDDYTVIDANLSTTPPAGLAWLSGDMNLDGTITGDDYTVIDANLGLGVGNPLTSSAVPEPAAGLVSAGAILCLRRRWKKTGTKSVGKLRVL